MKIRRLKLWKPTVVTVIVMVMVMVLVLILVITLLLLLLLLLMLLLSLSLYYHYYILLLLRRWPDCSAAYEAGQSHDHADIHVTWHNSTTYCRVEVQQNQT